MEWQYELDDKVLFITALLARMIWENAEKEDEVEIVPVGQIKMASLLLIPVWATSEHWTLISINKDECTMRYFDSLSPPSGMCMKNAVKVIKRLKKIECLGWLNDDAIIPKWNAASQSNDIDCGIYVVHYMEEQIRNYRGEGLGHEWPQIITMRGSIIGTASQLKKQAEKKKETTLMEKEKEKEKASKEDKEKTDVDIDKAKEKTYKGKKGIEDGKHKKNKRT